MPAKKEKPVTVNVHISISDILIALEGMRDRLRDTCDEIESQIAKLEEAIDTIESLE